jgi:hypothetical protein
MLNYYNWQNKSHCEGTKAVGSSITSRCNDRSELKLNDDRHLLTSAPGVNTSRTKDYNKLNLMLSLSDALNNCVVTPPTTAETTRKRRPQNISMLN